MLGNTWLEVGFQESLCASSKALRRCCTARDRRPMRMSQFTWPKPQPQQRNRNLRTTARISKSGGSTPRSWASMDEHSKCKGQVKSQARASSMTIAVYFLQRKSACTSLSVCIFHAVYKMQVRSCRPLSAGFHPS